MQYYHEVDGNVIDVARAAAADNQIVYLPHVCNDQGVMGAGVALALKKAFPLIDTEYRAWCSRLSDLALGRVSYAPVEGGRLIVANMIAQSGFHAGPRPPIRYGALVTCMRTIADDVTEAWRHSDRSSPVSIIAPRFGAGLAGGDWSIIKQLIHETWLDFDIDVTIVNFK